MITAEQLARNVLLTELRARKTAEGLVSGAYRSAFRGQGLEFLEVREYVAGDDVRGIDWNVTARTGRPYLKRYAEDRDETVMLLLDVSRSTFIGVQPRKAEAMVEIFAALASAATRSRDQVGCILFSADVDRYIAPSRGQQHLLCLIREALAVESPAGGTGVAAALRFLCKVNKRRALAFVISDFLAADFSGDLRTSARQHDLIALSVFDSREAELPDCGLIDFEDAETGDRFTLDSGHPGVRAAYADAWRDRAEALRDLFRTAGVDHIAMAAESDRAAALIRFLRARAARS